MHNPGQLPIITKLVYIPGQLHIFTVVYVDDQLHMFAQSKVHSQLITHAFTNEMFPVQYTCLQKLMYISRCLLDCMFLLCKQCIVCIWL